MNLPFRLAGRRVGRAGEGCLLPEERALLSGAATPKRRAEFCAGRQAGRAALARLFGSPGARAAILRAPSGRPYAAEPGTGRAHPYWVSISHAGGRALAVAATRRIGLDLVEIEPLGEGFRAEAFASGEIDGWCRHLGEAGDAAVATAFSAKEAALKWIGCGLRVPLASVIVTPLDAGRDPGAGGAGCGRPFHAALLWEGRRAACVGWRWRYGRWVWVALWSVQAEADYQLSRSL